jgi:hypoxanthine phosphoribosyltransferase
MTKEYMTWQQFDKACYKLAEKLRPTKFDNIYGPPRGGLVVAVRLSHLLKIPLILDIKNSTSNTIVVDDIADTGKTLKPFKSENCYLCVATLYYHRQSIVEPDFWIYEKTDKWIVFPWEKEVGN